MLSGGNPHTSWTTCSRLAGVRPGAIVEEVVIACGVDGGLLGTGKLGVAAGCRLEEKGVRAAGRLRKGDETESRADRRLTLSSRVFARCARSLMVALQAKYTFQVTFQVVLPGTSGYQLIAESLQLTSSS